MYSPLRVNATTEDNANATPIQRKNKKDFILLICVNVQFSTMFFWCYLIESSKFNDTILEFKRLKFTYIVNHSLFQ